MTTLQEKLNNLTDKDWGWWPVLWLRPRKAERMFTRLYLWLTLIFGSGAAAIILLVSLIRSGAPSVSYSIGVVSFVWLLYFISYRVTFGRAWNARADAMRPSQSGPNQPPQRNGGSRPSSAD